MLLHAQHQEITDDLDLAQVAEKFVDANDEDRNILDQRITLGNIKNICLIYIHHRDSIISVR